MFLDERHFSLWTSLEFCRGQQRFDASNLLLCLLCISLKLVESILDIYASSTSQLFGHLIMRVDADVVNDRNFAEQEVVLRLDILILLR